MTGATALAIAVGGMITAGTLVVAGPLVTPARADGLKPFDDCAALLDWYVERGLKDVGPYGWDSGVIAYATDLGVMRDVVPLTDVRGSLSGLAPAAEAAVPKANSATGTNTQEADVDEPDVAKTNGTIVVRLVEERTLVVYDVTGAKPNELGRLDLPKNVYGGELVLAGDRVLVLTSSFAQPMPMGGPAILESDLPQPAYRGKMWAPPSGSRLLDIDISDPAAPRLAHVEQYSGQLVSARVYGDQVRLVTSTGRPQLRWTYPGKRITDRQATLRNRELVRRTTIEDWLPTVTSAGQKKALTDCDQVLHPKEWSGDQTLAVTTFDAGDVTDQDTVGITADGQVVYSSGDRLYVASSRMSDPVVWNRPMIDRVVPPESLAVVTDLHAFALDGSRTTYVASGSIRGSLRDRWSLDEHDGILRVAWTREGRQVHNGISTMAERDGKLAEIGEVGDLGIDENIQSVRWFDDFAVLVTFRQMDPLYTVDLTDPAHPRELGALKIPGYSGYLHPIGGDRLLGLGVDATTQGEGLGSQAAVFDIGDLTDPKRISKESFGRQSSLPALDDPRIFTWLPEERTGLTTVSNWYGDAKLIALKVSPSGALSTTDLAENLDGYTTRILPLGNGRVAVVDRDVRVLDVG